MSGTTRITTQAAITAMTALRVESALTGFANALYLAALNLPIGCVEGLDDLLLLIWRGRLARTITAG